ncbi:hypothetical protein WS98_25385 [Burkholderia territorii]|nr:hypothetical protein WS98_25385 [Burkholderia territorii]
MSDCCAGTSEVVRCPFFVAEGQRIFLGATLIVWLARIVPKLAIGNLLGDSFRIDVAISTRCRKQPSITARQYEQGLQMANREIAQVDDMRVTVFRVLCRDSPRSRIEIDV